AAFSACSRAPEESDVTAPEAEENSEPKKAVTFSDPSDMPLQLVGEDEETVPAPAPKPEDTEENPPSPEHIQGLEAKMAEDILAMPEGEAQALAFTELIRRWSATDPEGA